MTTTSLSLSVEHKVRGKANAENPLDAIKIGTGFIRHYSYMTCRESLISALWGNLSPLVTLGLINDDGRTTDIFIGVHSIYGEKYDNIIDYVCGDMVSRYITPPSISYTEKVHMIHYDNCGEYGFSLSHVSLVSFMFRKGRQLDPIMKTDGINGVIHSILATRKFFHRDADSSVAVNQLLTAFGLYLNQFNSLPTGELGREINGVVSAIVQRSPLFNLNNMSKFLCFIKKFDVSNTQFEGLKAYLGGLDIRKMNLVEKGVEEW